MVLFSFLVLAIIIIIFFTFIRFNCLIVTIDHSSMYPTLVPGDRILVLRRWPANWLRKGKIVLLKMEHVESSLAGTNSSPSSLYVKRIVGVGGETLVTTREREEIISDNDQFLLRSEQRKWHIPASFLFVRGDNRANSLDSHHWGPIPAKCVQGMMLLRMRRSSSTNSTHAFLQGISQSLTIGEDAPAFEASTLNGESVNLQTYNKECLLLIFFAPSRILTEQFFQHNLQIPGVAESGTFKVLVSSASLADTRTFLDKVRVDLPVLIAPLATNPMFQDYKVISFPYYCYIDIYGKIIATGHINVKGKE